MLNPLTISQKIPDLAELRAGDGLMVCGDPRSRIEVAAPTRETIEWLRGTVGVAASPTLFGSACFRTNQARRAEQLTAQGFVPHVQRCPIDRWF